MSRHEENFWATLPLGRGVTLITRDANGLAALSKPAGILSHPNAPRDQPRSLLNARYEQDGEYFEWESGADTPPAAISPLNPQSAIRNPQSAPRRLWLLNRLDSATSGVLLVAASETLAREIRAMFQRRHIHKTYAALVFGTPPENRQHWQDRLAIEKHQGQIRANAVAGHIPAGARMTLLRSSRPSARPLSLIQLEPETGRSHQLRVQCARRHLPIVGDATYGDFRANRDFAKRTGEKRLFLHSLETRFDYEHAGRAYTFAARAELPEAFAAALQTQAKGRV
jgi:23S rRNA-/tRNA-specific pseudouridylate synthase